MTQTPTVATEWVIINSTQVQIYKFHSDMAKGRYKNTLRRIDLVRAIVREHYEPGNQSKCYKAIWRRYVDPVYPMSYRTFWGYMNAKPPDKDDHPTLFE